MKIYNRRYTGSKNKLVSWLNELFDNYCVGCSSFFDVFAGTGVVSASVIGKYNKLYINDFLYSNEIIYRAFFQSKSYNKQKIENIANSFNCLDASKIEPNYISNNYGNKYFKKKDSLLIGDIRERIEEFKESNLIDTCEYNILLASLLYSIDKCANTVGHYESYIQNSNKMPDFKFKLIEPFTRNIDNVYVFREDANKLVRKIEADVVFLDPPYNSRQYSRFYHVLETITKWDKPKLTGIAMKPPLENMSEYCRINATDAFADLINNIKAKYIFTTYSNTYNSKSTSSKNKIIHSDIINILKNKGNVIIKEKEHGFFNAGKTDFNDHKEYAFITKVV